MEIKEVNVVDIRTETCLPGTKFVDSPRGYWPGGKRAFHHDAEMADVQWRPRQPDRIPE